MNFGMEAEGLGRIRMVAPAQLEDRSIYIWPNVVELKKDCRMFTVSPCVSVC